MQGVMYQAVAVAAGQLTRVVLELVDEDLAVGHHKPLHPVHLQGQYAVQG